MTAESLREALAAATARLAAAGVESARFDAEELAAHLLEVSRTRLLTIDHIDGDAYRALIDQRADRRPLQHLTGVAHFRRVSLAVGPGVFVPRPETEVMVGRVIDFMMALPGAARVVDLCTGSGAIAAAIAAEVPDATVHAVEIDPGAHRWAAANLAGSGVVLHLGDARTALAELDGTFDVVVANPPYIPIQAWESVAVEARDHDPPAALWGGGSDGLDVIRAIETRASGLLRSGGLVAVEHADAQGSSAPSVFRSCGRWRQVGDHRDLTGRDRFLTAVRI